MTLIEHLKQIRDFRTQPNYPLWAVLLLVILGTISGYNEYRPWAQFVARHQAEVLEHLQLPNEHLPVSRRLSAVAMTT